MPTNLAARVALALSGSFDNLLDVNNATYPLSFSQNFNFDNGTGANKARTVFTDTRTLAASATESLDLSGALTDAYNNVISFTKIKAIVFAADGGNTNDVIIGNAGANAFVALFGAAGNTSTVVLKPGGMIAFVAPNANGYAVTDATADLLKVANAAAGTGVTYTVIIIGE